MSLNQLKKDMEEMINLSRQIGVYQAKYYYIADVKHKSYDQQLADIVLKKQIQCENDLFLLKQKWFE